jgi:hypothetical protein
MATVTSVRRYRLLKRFDAFDRGDGEMGGAWRAKQEATAGEDLPAAFPSRAVLVTAGYATLEDITGADVPELLKRTSLTRRQADAVIAALA